jgi:hypothetical protein
MRHGEPGMAARRHSSMASAMRGLAQNAGPGVRAARPGMEPSSSMAKNVGIGALEAS